MLQPVVSVVLPARNEAPTVGAIVRAIAGLQLPNCEIAEVVVVDDGSTDETAAVARNAGARVIDAAATLVEHADTPGKGQAMWKGLAETEGDIVVFCDADLQRFDPAYVSGLVEALTADPDATLAKPRYQRAGPGGRVSELMAKPALELLHPGVAWVAQPLGGEYAAWRHVLEQIEFVRGYGVDLGLLLDIAERFGPASIVEAELAIREHRNRTLDELRPQARAVLEVALHRAGLLEHAPPSCPSLASILGPRGHVLDDAIV